MATIMEMIRQAKEKQAATPAAPAGTQTAAASKLLAGAKGRAGPSKPMFTAAEESIAGAQTAAAQQQQDATTNMAIQGLGVQEEQLDKSTALTQSGLEQGAQQAQDVMGLEKQRIDEMTEVLGKQLNSKDTIRELNQSAEERMWNNESRWAQDMETFVFGQGYKDLFDSWGIRNITTAKIRDIEEAVMRADVDSWIDMAEMEIQTDQSRQMAEGIGSIVTKGADYGIEQGWFDSDEYGLDNLPGESTYVPTGTRSKGAQKS